MPLDVRLRLFVAVLLLQLAPLALAGDTPQEALREIALAHDLKSVEKHLPNSVGEALHKLDATGRQRALDALLFGKRMKEQGTEIQVPEDGHALLVLHAEGGDTDVNVEREISDGTNALVVLHLGSTSARWGLIEVWLRMEDGEWRVTEFQREGFIAQKVDVEDPSLLAKYRDPEEEEREQGAAQTLRALNGALNNYRSQYPDVGYPVDLAVLGPPPSAPGTSDSDEASDNRPDTGAPQTSAEHAGLVEEEMAGNSFTANGYNFAYTSGGAGYWITASPVDHGKGPHRGFYTDESCVVRSTDEDRAAAATDGAFTSPQTEMVCLQ